TVGHFHWRGIVAVTSNQASVSVLAQQQNDRRARRGWHDSTLGPPTAEATWPHPGVVERAGGARPAAKLVALETSMAADATRGGEAGIERRTPAPQSSCDLEPAALASRPRERPGRE